MYIIVPLCKKKGQLRVYVDFRDLNNMCPKDDFPLSITELMVDVITGYEALSFANASLAIIKYGWLQRMKNRQFFAHLNVFLVIN